MPRTTLEITTDANGYFSATTPFDAPDARGATISVAATLLSPFATAVWGTLDVDAREGRPTNQPRAFVLWHSETVQLGSWRLEGGSYIIVVTGRTKPARANVRLVLEIDVAV